MTVIANITVNEESDLYKNAERTDYEGIRELRDPLSTDTILLIGTCTSLTSMNNNITDAELFSRIRQNKNRMFY